MVLTTDALSRGALEITQSKEGFRFGLDAVLLATDLPPLPQGGHVLDLGAAQGTVGLAIATRRPDVSLCSLERQQSLHRLLVRNIEDNGLSARAQAVPGDVRFFRDCLEPHSADLVVCNPPYKRAGAGLESPNAERAAALQELNGGLADFVAAAAYAAKPRARLKLIVPPTRLEDLLAATAATDFKTESLRFFHSRPGDAAYLVEAVLRRNAAADVVVRTPLFIYDGERYTDEVQARVDGVALVTSAPDANRGTNGRC